MNHSFATIGIIHSPFKEKFGVPRQPGIATAAMATLELLPPYDRDETLEGLDGFSHVWIIFVFHMTAPGIANAENDQRTGKCSYLRHLA